MCVFQGSHSCDLSQQWDTSKEEYRFDLYSISKEHLNNIKFKGHTVANIHIYNDNGDMKY